VKLPQIERPLRAEPIGAVGVIFEFVSTQTAYEYVEASSGSAGRQLLAEAV
jgi:hypothetical protein